MRLSVLSVAMLALSLGGANAFVARALPSQQQKQQAHARTRGVVSAVTNMLGLRGDGIDRGVVAWLTICSIKRFNRRRTHRCL